MRPRIAAPLLLALATAAAAAAPVEDISAWARNLELRDGMAVTLPAGVHHVRPDGLETRYLHITNNDDGEKAILFDLSGMEDITIEGNGAELVMHGHVIPFFMRKAKNIVIRNLTIDWAHPFYAQAEVTDAGEGWIDLRFEQEYPVQVRDGQLLAMNPDIADPVHFHNVNYIDPVRGEQAYRSKDDYHALKEGNYSAADTGNGIIRLESRHFRNRPEPGQIAVFQYSGRTAPAIAVQNSQAIRIEDVTQYHAAAIANVFEGSRDIYINRMTMTRRGSRWYSALNDATHFMDCAGEIRIENSLFEFQGDDATNIHGTYRAIERFLPDNGVRLRLMHFQHLGIDTLNTGDTIALLTRDDLERVHTAKILKVERISPEWMDVYCDEPFPEFEPAEYVLMNYITDVDVLIRGNRIQNNRARGLLIKTFGKVRIHDNIFHTPGPAILISAGLSHWYESGPVDDVEISNNVFDQCNFGDWGDGLVVIAAALADKSSEYPVMRNIRIHSNRIVQIRQPLLKANNVEGLQFFDNEIARGNDYPFQASQDGDYLFGAGVTTERLQPETAP